MDTDDTFTLEKPTKFKVLLYKGAATGTAGTNEHQMVFGRKVQATLTAEVQIDTSNTIPDPPPYAKYQIPNPHNERLTYFNKVTERIYEESYNDFKHPKEFENYNITTRRWRYAMETEWEELDKMVNSDLHADNNGRAHNIKRYKQLPGMSMPADLVRCGQTIEYMDLLIEKTKNFESKLRAKIKLYTLTPWNSSLEEEVP